NFRFSSMWSMYANLGLLNAQLRASNKPFPYAPHQTLAVGGIYTQGPWRASLGAQYAGESYYVYSNGATSPIQAHTLANASLRYTFDRGDTVQGLGLQKLTVSLNVDNLLDKTYNTSYGGSSSNPYVYLNMPRSYYLSLEARF
ncbi:MAG: TonB-dependent receptor, partial [Thiomonas sp. 14-66-4]